MCHASSTIERTGIASVANLIVRGVRCSRSKGESVCEEIDLPCIWCAPFEALYGRKCRSPVLWAEIGRVV
ncbi:hypothetical protein Tco_1124276 [Tanacetum coccineum]|uniref:Uncharacterized protein n=1 Tax=Tanacetum coccineum TaxID=301880 RepID=A0ABQ5J6C0_9ASTR